MKVFVSPQLSDIIDKYDGFLVDLWGVVHDGTALYPGAAPALAAIAAQKKPVVFLSNAPRVAAKAIAVLERMGIPRAHYITVVPPGQVAHDWLKSFAEGGLPPFASLPLPLRGSPSATQDPIPYYYLGPGKDEDI